jgi:manganese/zinc/iron transport system permease protein
MSPQAEIQLIAVVTAAACALPGAFLVLRRLAMLSDAISHAILPGIAVAFFLTESLNSPLLIIAAAGTGLLTVALIETLHRTGRVKEDAAIGLVFPVLFAIGVVLIARYASGVHLDIDAVLLGELAFAPFDRFIVGERDLGPQALWVMGSILLLNLAFLVVFYKEIKLSTFDAGLAAALGFAPAVLHYALMGLVSITAVGAFDAVGSILVVALMVAPPSTAYLLTDRLPVMLGLSAGIGAGTALVGYAAAHAADTSIAGAMATAAGLAFVIAFAFAPERGLVAQKLRRHRQRRQFAAKMLTVHLLHHDRGPEADRECRVSHLTDHLNWQDDYASLAVQAALRENYVLRSGDRLTLTPAGREHAREAMVE